jgi:hypothetical protein
MSVEHGGSHPLGRPVVGHALAPRFVQRGDSDGRIGRRERIVRTRGCLQRHARGSKPESKQPEADLIVIRVERVEVAVAIDRRARRLAALE